MSKLLGALNGLTVLHGGDDAAARARVVAVAALRKNDVVAAVLAFCKSHKTGFLGKYI